MDSFEINKIIAAVLLIALLVIGIGKISDIAFHVDKPEKSAYKVDIEESTQVSSSLAEKIDEEVDISALLALGDISHEKYLLMQVMLKYQLLHQFFLLMNLKLGCFPQYPLCMLISLVYLHGKRYLKFSQFQLQVVQ